MPRIEVSSMSETSLIVPTLFKARFRRVDKNALPRWCGVGGDYSFKKDAMALARQDTTMRFLLEMDRKLDTILSLLQTASLEEDFPHKGYVLELGASRLVLECREKLEPGEHMELLLMLGGYPMRMLSVMGTADAETAAPRLVDKSSRTYAVSYECLSEEDRDGVIAFIFQEDRKRIRRRKEES